MAVIQDIYNTQPAIGFPGQVANGETSNRISRDVEDAAGIAMTGKAVFAGTDDRGCTATVKTVDDFLGFTILNHGQPLLPGGTADTVPQRRSIGIIDRGGVNVVAKGTGNDRAPVFIEAGTGAITASSAAGNIATNGWRFDDTFVDGQTVRINRR